MIDVQATKLVQTGTEDGLPVFRGVQFAKSANSASPVVGSCDTSQSRLGRQCAYCYCAQGSYRVYRGRGDASAASTLWHWQRDLSLLRRHHTHRRSARCGTKLAGSPTAAEYFHGEHDSADAR